MRKFTIAVCMLALVACDTGETESDADPTLELEPDVPAQALDADQTADGPLTVETMPDGREYLTAANGMALYALEGRDDPSACVDACVAAWPPYTGAESVNPSAPGDGPVQAALVGSVQRPDGTTQMTYDGHPLYLYAQDTGAGQTTGQDVHDEWGEWYLVQPSGDMLHGETGASEASGTDAAAAAPSER